MPRKPIKFDLDFMKKDIFSRFTVKQFDDLTFTITPLLNNEPYDTSNMTGVIYVGVNNEMFKQDTNITVSSNSIVVTLDKNMLSKDGRAYAEIELTDSAGTVTSSSFIFDIDRKIGEGATIPGAIEGFVEKYAKLTEEFKKQFQTYTNDLDTRFNTLTASQQQDAEVIDARKGETSLRVKMDKIDEQFNTIKNNNILITNPLDKSYFNNAYLRIPFVEVTNNNILICGGDIRYDGSNDIGNIEIGISRSLDFGKTWQTPKIVLNRNAITTKSRVHDGLILHNKNTNRLFIFGLKINSDNGIFAVTKDETDFVYKYSDDDGVTWSSEYSLKHLFPSSVTTMYSGIGKGITMNDGTLVVPVQVKNNSGATYDFQSGVIISSDNGVTWQFNGGLLPCYSSECNVIERQNGMLLINVRSNSGYRRMFNSWDKGATWNAYTTDNNTLVDTGCQGSFDLLTIGSQNYGLFINPNMNEIGWEYRKNITLKATNNFIDYYPVFTFVDSNTQTDGYSCICNKNGRIFAVIERRGTFEFYDLTSLKQSIINTNLNTKTDFTLNDNCYDVANKTLKITPSSDIVRVDGSKLKIIEKITGGRVGQIITLIKNGGESYVKLGVDGNDSILSFNANTTISDIVGIYANTPLVLQYTNDKKWIVLSPTYTAKDRAILTLDIYGCIRVTPNMKVVNIDIANSQNTMFKGVIGALPGQELFISNLDSANPLSFNYNVDGLPSLGDEDINIKTTCYPHTRADIKTYYNIDNTIKHGGYLHCVISAGFAEIINIKDFITLKA